jgi:hypothetical protein
VNPYDNQTPFIKKVTNLIQTNSEIHKNKSFILGEKSGQTLMADPDKVIFSTREKTIPNKHMIFLFIVGVQPQGPTKRKIIVKI